MSGVVCQVLFVRCCLSGVVCQGINVSSYMGVLHTTTPSSDSVCVYENQKVGFEPTLTFLFCT